MKKGKSTRAGAVKQTKQVLPVKRKAPQRTCVACRQVGDKRQLIRLVRRPDGEVVVDELGRLPGRGAYLCYREGCWQEIAPPLGRALKMLISPETKEMLLARGREIIASRLQE